MDEIIYIYISPSLVNYLSAHFRVKCRNMDRLHEQH